MREGSGSNLEPGSTIGNYTIVRELGRGGMGAVYEARHLRLKKTVAIKVLHGKSAEDPEVKARFVREGQAASVIRHPNIVDVSDVGDHGVVTYLVMEYLPGENLEVFLARRGRLTPQEAIDLLLPVFSAIAAAHNHGVIHRDLKPANVILSTGPQGRVVPKVVDFGISKVPDGGSSGGYHPLTMTGALLGTPYFMSPEQVTGARDVDPRCDQYALGVILYQCLTGRLPFQEPNLYATLISIGQGRYPAPCEVEPSIPERLGCVIARAMHVDPAQRFASLVELTRALLPWAGARTQRDWTDAFALVDEERAMGAVAQPGAGGAVDAQLQSTLRRSAVSVDRVSASSPSLRRSQGMRIAVAVGAVLLIGLGLSARFRSQRSDSRQAIASHPPAGIASVSSEARPPEPSNPPQPSSVPQALPASVSSPILDRRAHGSPEAPTRPTTTRRNNGMTATAQRGARRQPPHLGTAAGVPVSEGNLRINVARDPDGF